MTELAAISIFGAAGSILRYHLGAFVHTRTNGANETSRHFPYGTLFVNLLGSFLLGVIASLAEGNHIAAMSAVAFSTGFCGAFTTFSTLAVELARFLAEKRYAAFFILVAISALAGLGAVYIGFQLVNFAFASLT